jgi:hypothetical protein
MASEAAGEFQEQGALAVIANLENWRRGRPHSGACLASGDVRKLAQCGE